MKTLCFLLCVLLIFGALTIQADYLGIKKSSETISFFLNEPLDSAGLPIKPDSAHIFTYADNASAATFTTRSTTYPFSAISIDTLKIYGDTTYVFADAIADIDGAGGNFELAIEVKLFADGLPTSTRATVQVIVDSLGAFLDDIRDSLESQDDWVSSLAASDNIGINWADVSNPTSEVDLSSTTISTTQNVANVSGSVGSVTGAVGSVTGNVGGDVVGAVNLDNATGTLANTQIDDDVDVNTKTITASAITATAIANNAITNNELATTAVDEITNGLWDEDTTGHSTANSYGKILADPSYVQGAGGDPWATALPGAYGAGTAGKIVGDNVNATISSRSTHSAADVWTVGTRTITGDTYTPDVNVTAMAANVVNATALAANAVAEIEAAVYANRTDYMADLTATNDSINAVLDSVQLWDDDIALLVAIRDSINALLDSLQHPNTYKAVGFSTFDAASDCVIIQDTLETGDSVAVMPDFWSAADSAAYQGSGAGLTKADIADTVWAKLTEGTNEQEFWADLAWVLAKIDTLAMRQGLEPGSWFAIRRWSDKDSLWMGHSTDTLLVQELIHPAGGVGAPPDSGNTY